MQIQMFKSLSFNFQVSFKCEASDVTFIHFSMLLNIHSLMLADTRWPIHTVSQRASSFMRIK